MDADTKNHKMVPVERNENDPLDSPDNVIIMPDIYADEATVEVEALTLEGERASRNTESPGFNPYDTGILKK